MERSAPDDRELIAATLRGETSAFAALVERYQQMVCAVSFSATGDRALSEDIAQDAFIAAWSGLAQLRDPARLAPWLCGIARNLGRKALRDTGREKLVEPTATDELKGDEVSPLEAVLDAESETLVWNALRRLPEKNREAMVLYYGEGESVKQVAAALGISEDAVMQRLSRGRQQLKRRVSGVVERSLRSMRPSPKLVGAVVAALPTTGALLHAEAAATKPAVDLVNGHGGTIMIKAGILAIAAAGLAGAGIVWHQAGDHEVVAAGPVDVAAVPVAPAERVARSTTASRAIAPPGQKAGGVPAGPGDCQSGLCETRPEPAAPDPELIAALRVESGPSRGPANAPVTIVVFHDFACGFCGKVLGTIDQLFDDYPGKIRLVVKQFPVHEHARLAHEAVLAADDQGKFWAMHDLIMANQDNLSEEALVGYARQAGLDMARFRADLAEHRFAEAVADDVDQAVSMGVTGAPSFLINGERITGARPPEFFRSAIDAALTKANGPG